MLAMRKSLYYQSRKTTKGPKVFLTRANREIVKRLFEMMIPEIADGSIEIMGIAREPGEKTKIGVLSLKTTLMLKGPVLVKAG